MVGVVFVPVGLALYTPARRCGNQVKYHGWYFWARDARKSVRQHAAYVGWVLIFALQPIHSISKSPVSLLLRLVVLQHCLRLRA